MTDATRVLNAIEQNDPVETIGVFAQPHLFRCLYRRCHYNVVMTFPELDESAVNLRFIELVYGQAIARGIASRQPENQPE